MARPMSEEVKRILAENPNMDAATARKRVSRMSRNNSVTGHETNNVTDNVTLQDNVTRIMRQKVLDVTKPDNVTSEEYAERLGKETQRPSYVEKMLGEMLSRIEALEAAVASLQRNNPDSLRNHPAAGVRPGERPLFTPPGAYLRDEVEPQFLPKDGVGKKKGKASIPGTSSAAGGVREEEFSE